MTIELVNIDTESWTKIEGFSSKGLRVKSWFERICDKEVFLYKEPKIYKYSDNIFITKEIWTELIACKIGKFLGLDITEAIPACIDGNFGILIKNFLERGSAGMPISELIEAKDFFTKINASNQHNLLFINMLLQQSKIDETAWNKYLEMLVFDTLIGNNDRHDENWGFLYDRHKRIFKLSPIYDNASCLTSGETEERVNELLSDSNKLIKYVKNSRPPNLYISSFDLKHYKHFEIIEYLLKNYAETKDVISKMLKDDYLGYTEEVIHEIQQLDVPNQYKLSDNRKKLIIKILDLRRNILKGLINVHN